MYTPSYFSVFQKIAVAGQTKQKINWNKKLHLELAHAKYTTILVMNLYTITCSSFFFIYRYVVVPENPEYLMHTDLWCYRDIMNVSGTVYRNAKWD